MKERKPNGYFRKMKDFELIDWIEKNEKGKNLQQLNQSSILYKIAKERGLIDSLVKNGVLVRNRKPNGFFKDMTDEDVKKYYEKNYKPKSPRPKPPGSRPSTSCMRCRGTTAT